MLEIFHLAVGNLFISQRGFQRFIQTLGLCLRYSNINAAVLNLHLQSLIFQIFCEISGAEGIALFLCVGFNIAAKEFCDD